MTSNPVSRLYDSLGEASRPEWRRLRQQAVFFWSLLRNDKESNKPCGRILWNRSTIN